MKMFRVDVRLRNNRLIRRREELGLSPRQLSEKIGIGYGSYLDYEALKINPVFRDNDHNRRLGNIGWKANALAIATFHGVSPNELWPDAILAVQETRKSIELDPQDLPAIAGISRAPIALPESVVIHKELASTCRRVMATLNPREQRVIQLRFGLDGKEEMTLDEVAASFGGRWSRERIRQIEAKALRKLRHPIRRKHLAVFAADEGDEEKR